MAGRFLLRNPLSLLEAIFTLRTYPVVKTPQRARQVLFSQNLPEQLLLEYHAKMQVESFRAFLDLLGLSLVHPKRVKTPVLVLGGEKDWVLGPDTSRHTRTRSHSGSCPAASFADRAGKAEAGPGRCPAGRLRQGANLMALKCKQKKGLDLAPGSRFYNI